MTNECDHPEKVQCSKYDRILELQDFTIQEENENPCAYHTGLRPYPNDCSKFIHCANGQAFIQNCGPGTLFNSLLQTCDWPRNVNCGQTKTHDSNAHGHFTTEDDNFDANASRYVPIYNRKTSKAQKSLTTEYGNQHTVENSKFDYVDEPRMDTPRQNHDQNSNDFYQRPQVNPHESVQNTKNTPRQNPDQSSNDFHLRPQINSYAPVQNSRNTPRHNPEQNSNDFYQRPQVNPHEPVRNSINENEQNPKAQFERTDHNIQSVNVKPLPTQNTERRIGNENIEIFNDELEESIKLLNSYNANKGRNSYSYESTWIGSAPSPNPYATTTPIPSVAEHDFSSVHEALKVLFKPYALTSQTDEVHQMSEKVARNLINQSQIVGGNENYDDHQSDQGIINPEPLKPSNADTKCKYEL